MFVVHEDAKKIDGTRAARAFEKPLAAFSPTSAFSRLDLPTFDRPRNAISGTPALGNCAASTAESKNCAVNRIPISATLLISLRGDSAGSSYRSATAKGRVRSVRSVGAAASKARV